MTLNLKQILRDLQDEKEAIDETIAALEALVRRQRKSVRKALSEGRLPPPSKQERTSVASKT